MIIVDCQDGQIDWKLNRTSGRPVVKIHLLLFMVF